MAKPNYQFEKRQRDLAKKSKQEEKRRQKLADKAGAEELAPATGSLPSAAPNANRIASATADSDSPSEN
ncbi:MAG: hypothetical protein M0P39_13010 [Rhodocyclaceae bacterium]|nr:hypothetical protein [Rhodocyclaceae bacterium]